MSEHRLHQCHRDGCDSMARYSVDMSIECTPENGPSTDVHMHATIKVCEAHRGKVMDWILTPENKAVIRATLMQQYPEPVFETARLIFNPLDVDKVVLAPIAKCDRAGCANPAKWQVKQTFEIGRRKAELLTNLCVCDHHKGKTKRADFLDDGSKLRVERTMRTKGVVHVPFRTMKIEFIPLVLGQRTDAKEFVG